MTSVNVTEYSDSVIHCIIYTLSGTSTSNFKWHMGCLQASNTICFYFHANI